ncbi:DsbC family protein [Wenzhouxiangella sp. XN201]|uniref:DsbC family protein n=1 Tax=Wenzhouxiangella sp. XN201 TaxID=2710755 RepID=UPI0013CC2C69|nr:DsbC family protein [Wenzhouxiangella sp. XN201]NEZ04569.1 DsbC family protein [Wenzhouxiangella sp. XN201]
MKISIGIGSLVGLILALPAMAADEQAIEERIRALVPEVETLAIAETPVPGLMEVQLNNDIIYMSKDGRYLMQGRLIDLETQNDLTDTAKSGLRRERIADLDSADMVSFGPEDAEFELMVFTDTDCGYCRRLHEQIDAYVDEGIRINYLAFPRAGIESATYETMVSVWCASDRQSAMTTAKSGQKPPKAECDNPVEEQYLLGQALGVTGTPALLTPNGDLIPGYVPPGELKKRLQGLADASASSAD